jgi:hypothetical protein
VIERVGGYLGAASVFDHPGFDGPGAAETPVRGDHFLRLAALQAVGDATGQSRLLPVKNR